MKKFILFLFVFFSFNCAFGETLRATVTKDEIPKGFFGTWHVTSKIKETNNRALFNPLSVDIWTLSGWGNTLFLENVHSGATSSIQISNGQNLDGKTLKFERTKEDVRGNIKIVQKESPTFRLNGDIFTGEDIFIIERYKNNQLFQKDVVKYNVVGQKISGESG